ncbi:hypothetical protein H4S06_004070 [Coemansia sp. BCRC 34490]|nr:hypothetical protein H4S06_004070 [Coemansia sp. BCRC 34490]
MLSPTLTHVLYMDDAAVFLSSFEHYGALATALQRYCRATNAKFNDDKTEAFTIGPCTGQPPADLRLTMPGTPIRHLGAPVGINLDHREIAKAKIEEVIATAARYTRRPMTVLDRALILRTYAIPKLSYLYHALHFTDTELHDFDRRIRRLMWTSSRPFLNQDAIALPVRDGGLGMAKSVDSHKIAQIQWGQRLLCAADTATSNNAVIRATTPTWYWLLVATWHHDIKHNAKDRKTMSSIADKIGWINAFWDPIMQHSSTIRPRLKIIGPQWYHIIASFFRRDERRLQVRLNLDEPRGNTQRLPLLGTDTLSFSNNKQWTTLAKAIIAAHANNECPPTPWLMLNWLPIVKPNISRHSKILREKLTALEARINTSTEPYWKNLEIAMPGNRRAEPLPAANWECNKLLRKTLQRPVTLQAPQLAPACAPFVHPPNAKHSLFRRVHSLIAPPSARNALFRLLHDRIPPWMLEEQTMRTCPACDTGVIDSAEHILASCPKTDNVRHTFINNWLNLYERAAPIIEKEAAEFHAEPAEGRKAMQTTDEQPAQANSAIPADQATPANLEFPADSAISTKSANSELQPPGTQAFPLLHAAATSDSALNPTNTAISDAENSRFDMQSCDLAPSLPRNTPRGSEQVHLPPSFWMSAPYMMWEATQPHIHASHTAKKFQHLWQLASSLLLFTLWLRRCDSAYRRFQWPTDHTAQVYNVLLQRYWISISGEHTAARSWLPCALLGPRANQEQGIG